MPETVLLFWQVPGAGVAVTVMVELPAGVVLLVVVMVRFEVLFAPVLVSEAGLNEADAPVGSPLALRATVQDVLFPPKTTVTV